ncbi:MAG: Ig-like domain-containing protein [Bacteroidia bacterium]|nr:Ig-like domain-containing protein [Bacteroidia bacterium]
MLKTASVPAGSVSLKYWGMGLFFIFIVSASLYAQRPYISAAFPRNGATNIECNSFISVSLQFPSEGKMLDPVTLNPTSVRLFPQNEPETLIAARLAYNPEFRTLTLTPLEVLLSRTTYIFEVTENLVDDRGFGFMPYQLVFYTGDCLPEPEVAFADSLPEMQIAEDSVIPPITWLDRLYAYRRGDSLEVRWRTVQEYMNADFTVDRSSDGKTFEILDRIDSKGDSYVPQYYSWLDVSPKEGKNFYRLTLADIYGQLAHTDTISVFIRKVRFRETTLREGEPLNVQFVIDQKTTMAFVLKSVSDEILVRKAGAIPPGVQERAISLGDTPPGRYMAILRTPEDTLIAEIQILAR